MILDYICNIELLMSISRGYFICKYQARAQFVAWTSKSSVAAYLTKHLPKSYIIYIFTNLKLCLATATHNFKWVNITHICWIWD